MTSILHKQVVGKLYQLFIFYSIVSIPEHLQVFRSIRVFGNISQLETRLVASLDQISTLVFN